MRRFIGRLYRDDSGATAIEYGLICGLIFVGIVVAVTAFTDASGAMYERIRSAMMGAVGGS
ncbi:Flp family type IVb pilin [Brevundimonas pondensis]|uniref:Flp family type IVb pilin n=1 Tax=Brevundimonas pondensis TaxID=2774189 RepID=A0ABX7SI92_9CAUL|nr:Flp family type IVb pilin [Brevundimonas pondensis]QTC87399.1 Flp family type IVb pilin [Brevundimonas pondensis]